MDRWSCVYDDVTVVIYCVGLSDFELLCCGDDTNRLVESLNVFEEVSNSEKLRNKPIALVFTKADRLKKELKNGVLFHQYIPEYDGNEFINN
jgi:hypothetical protein